MFTTVLLVVVGVILLGLCIIIYQINNRLMNIDYSLNRDEEERVEIK